MYLKFLINLLATTIILVMSGVSLVNCDKMKVSNEETENVIIEEENLVSVKEEVEELKSVPENKKEEQIVENKNLSEGTNTKKEVTENNSNTETKNESSVVVETEKETKEEIKEETTEEVQIKEESTKEVIEYNDMETRRMVNDINLLAKQNPDLWDKNGNPLYEVRIDKSAMNGEYMYPYSIDRIRGKVLNVFPVRFVVYVVDIKRPGFQKEMKYYILVTNL